MGKYTTELRTICEDYAHVEEPISYDQIATIIEAGRQGIFDFDYPIWDPSYKPVLEKKIIKHYFTREIGEETYGLWKFRLDTKLNEIMPYYNNLYESTVLEFNPLYDVNYRRTHTGEGTSTSEGTDAINGSDTNTQTNNLTNRKTGTTTEEIDKTTSTALSGTYGNQRTDNLSDRRTGTESSTTSGGDTTEVTNEGQNEDSRTANSRTYSDNTHKTTVLDHDSSRTHLENDTPQGGLPGNYQSSTDYLSSWTKDDESQDADDDETIAASGTSSETFTDIHKLDTVQTTEVTKNSTDTKTLNTTDAHTGTQNTSGSQSEDTTVDEDGTITRTDNLSDTSTGTVTNSGTSSSTRTTTGDVSTTDQYVEEVVGHQSGSYAKAILEFRETLMNIDMLIIDELGELFIKLW